MSSPKLIVPTNLQMVIAPAGMVMERQSPTIELCWRIDRGFGRAEDGIMQVGVALIDRSAAPTCSGAGLIDAEQ